MESTSPSLLTESIVTKRTTSSSSSEEREIEEDNGLSRLKAGKRVKLDSLVTEIRKEEGEDYSELVTSFFKESEFIEEEGEEGEVYITKEQLSLLPEVLRPCYYYPWVELLLSDDPELETWHIDRVIQIDQTTGRLELCQELIELGITKFNLNLSQLSERVKWLVSLSQLDPETFPTSFQTEVTLLLDLTLKELINWNSLNFAQLLHRLVTFGSSPQPLLSFLVSHYEELSKEEDYWLSLLDLPQDSSKKLDNWDKKVELLFVKVCYLGLLSGPSSSRKSGSVFRLLEKLTTLPEVEATETLVSQFDPDIILSFTHLSQAYPIYSFLSTQLPTWEIVEQYHGSLPSLPELLSRYLTGTSTQHRRWLDHFVRTASVNLTGFSELSDFWADLQELTSVGYFGSTTVKQLGISLVEALFASERFDLVTQICDQPELFLDTDTVESLILAASQERFDNATSISRTEPGIQEAYRCLECLKKVASPQFQSWKAFLDGATQLEKVTSQSSISGIMPLDLRLHPREQLISVLGHPRCNLYRNPEQLLSLAQLLGIEDEYSLQVDILQVAERRKDFTVAYAICMAIMENDPSEEEVEVCISLARNAKFPDLDKRTRIVALGLSACHPSQCHRWLTCYRELEAGRSHSSSQALPQCLFQSSSEESLPALKATLEHWPTCPFSPPLRDHPMYAVEVSSSGDDFYDGTTRTAPPEYGYRLSCIVADASLDPTIVSTDPIKQHRIRLTESPDTVLSTLHLLHLPQEDADKVLTAMPPTPLTALKTAYHYGLSYLPYTVDPKHHQMPPFDVTRLKPSQVIQSIPKRPAPIAQGTPSLAETHLSRASEAYADVFKHSTRVQMNTLLSDLSIPSEVFLSSPSSGKLALLESQASQLGPGRLEKVLSLADHSDLDKQPLVLAHVSGFFLTEDETHSTSSYWKEAIRPHLDSLDPINLRKKLDYVYERIDGTKLSSIALLNETYADSMKDTDENPEEIKLRDQLTLRKTILLPWVSFLHSTTVDFKKIVSAILNAESSSLPFLLSPLFSPDIIDAIAAQAEQLAQIRAIFEFESPAHQEDTDPDSDPDDNPLFDAITFNSIIYYGFTEYQINQLLKSNSVILPDAILPHINLAFPHMLAKDIINVLMFICSPNLSEFIPTLTIREILQVSLDVTWSNFDDPEELQGFQDRIAQFESRIDFIDALSELTDPQFEEDLGFFTVQVINTADFTSSHEIYHLLYQLMNDGIGPWLLQRVACLIHTQYPESLAEWHSDPTYGLVNTSDIPLLPFLLLSFLEEKNREKEDLTLHLSPFKKMGGTLRAYEGELESWASAILVSIRDTFHEVILPDPKIPLGTREKFLPLLYRDFDQSDFDGLEQLLEWRCFFIAASALESLSGVVPESTSGLLSDEELQMKWIDDLLEFKVDPIYLLDVLIIIGRYYQISTGSSFLDSSLSRLWIKVLTSIAKNYDQVQHDLYTLWRYCSSVLDKEVVEEEESGFLDLLYQPCPLSYYRIGLSSPHPDHFQSVFDKLLLATYDGSPYSDDPIVMTLVICRQQLAPLIGACPDAFDRTVYPLLTGPLAYPSLQNYALHSLADDFPDQAELLALKFVEESDPNLASGDAAPAAILRAELAKSYPLPTPDHPLPHFEPTIPTLTTLGLLLNTNPLPPLPTHPAPYLPPTLVHYLKTHRSHKD